MTENNELNPLLNQKANATDNSSECDKSALSDSTVISSENLTSLPSFTSCSLTKDDDDLKDYSDTKSEAELQDEDSSNALPNMTIFDIERENIIKCEPSENRDESYEEEISEKDVNVTDEAAEISKLTAEADENKTEAPKEFDPEERLNHYKEQFKRANSIKAKANDNAPKKKKIKYDPVRPRAIDTVFDITELFIFSLVAVLLFTSFLFRHSVVEGSSMEDTLHENEHLIISDLFYTPKRGDIIVCEDFSTSLRKPIVKRVIGIAGDHVEVDTLGRVKLNGEILNEPYYHIDGPVLTSKIDIIVPEGELFILGDHRNNSTDSREFGTVDTDSVIGKVLFRFYPLDKLGKVN